MQQVLWCLLEACRLHEVEIVFLHFLLLSWENEWSNCVSKSLPMLTNSTCYFLWSFSLRWILSFVSSKSSSPLPDVSFFSFELFLYFSLCFFFSKLKFSRGLKKLLRQPCKIDWPSRPFIGNGINPSAWYTLYCWLIRDTPYIAG